MNEQKKLILILVQEFFLNFSQTSIAKINNFIIVLQHVKCSVLKFFEMDLDKIFSKMVLKKQIGEWTRSLFRF